MHNKSKDSINGIIKKAGLAVGATGVAMLTACTFNPFSNEAPCVYGPPPEDPAVYTPDKNEPEEIYGPPEMFGEESDEEFEEDVEEDSDKDNEAEDGEVIINPDKEDADIEEETEEDTLTSEDGVEPEVFVPDENISVCMYGPPEMMKPEIEYLDE